MRFQSRIALFGSVIALLAASGSAFAEPAATVAGVLQATPDYSKAQEAFDASNTPSLPPFNRAPLPTTYQPRSESAPSNPVPFKVGMSFDLSVPSGAAIGLEARLPYVPWFKFGVAGTYTLAPGARGNILIDPIKFPVAPVLNVDVGHQFPFTVPGVNNSPSVDFNYCDLQGGLAFGSRDGFRFMLLGGMSYLDGTVHNFQGVLPVSSNGLVVSDPNFHGWAPDAKLGFEFLF